MRGRTKKEQKRVKGGTTGEQKQTTLKSERHLVWSPRRITENINKKQIYKHILCNESRVGPF